MEEVLELYERPLNPKEPVVCLDEKPVVLHAEVRPPRPAAPGRVARRDGEYERRGTANTFCVVEPKAGRHFTRATANRSATEFAKVVGHLVGRYPKADTIHLVMDNLNTHGGKALINFYGQQRGGVLWQRITPHYTPKHGSWLNQAEIALSLYARQCLGRRRIPDLAVLREQTRAWNARMNRHRITVEWKFDRSAARKTFRYRNHRNERSEH